MSSRAPRWLWLLVAGLAAYRLAYHLAYLLHDPFALGTISDGAVYESTARDLVAHAPLGTQPFYLQGLYAYVLALGIALTGSVLGGLCIQLALAVCAWIAATLALTRAFGARAGLWSTVALLAYFPLAFYENKYLSAGLGVATNVLVWLAFAMYTERATRVRATALGAASGLSMLGRPNMLLAVPFALFALALRSERAQRQAHVASFVVGIALALAPMAARNALVTGAASVFPAHGGGTSFYIGNNPSADGRWNSAGGLISGQVGLERTELLARLGLPSRSEREDAEAIGRALYARAFTFMRQEPAAWLRLEAKKLWLTLGNDELTQDFDMLGERELLPAWLLVGVPFGVLLALGLLGAVALVRTRREHSRAEPWLLVVGGQLLAVLAANVVYFTSAQHRLPLAVCLAALCGPGLESLWASLRTASPIPRNAYAWLAAALVLTVQAAVPRQKQQTRVSLAHLYNLSVVEEQAGDLVSAERSLARALERRPHDPVFLVEHASLLRRLGQFDGARNELDQLARTGLDAPRWVTRRAQIERAMADASRRDAVDLSSPGSR